MIFRFIVLFIFINFISSLSFSQKQSLWSEIRKGEQYSIGLSALPYEVPLWGQLNSFVNINKIISDNDWIGVHTWLVRDFNNDGFAGS